MARRGRKKSPFRIKIRLETVYSLSALFLFAIAGLIIISFSGQGQMLQALNVTMRELFGVAALFVPFIFITGGLVLTGAKWSFAKPQVFLGAVLFLLSMSTLTQAGSLGQDLFMNISALILPIGTYFFFGLLLSGSVLLATDTSLPEVFRFFTSMFELDTSDRRLDKGLAKISLSGQPILKDGVKINLNSQPKSTEPDKSAALSAGQAQSKDGKGQDKPAVNISKALQTNTSELSLPSTTNDPMKQQIWHHPPLTLLNQKMGGTADRGDVNKNAAIIENTLDSFGIKAKVREINGGPAVTQYALELAIGTKLSKVTSLANDLALALAAPTGQIRIEAPIAGRNLVGIEIPNRSPEFVTMKAMLNSEAMKKNPSKLAVALGLNVSGQPIIADISKMPHVLIAGSTGSGKSVAVNAFVASILFRASPQEVKFIMVDPKRVELTGYNDIPHLLTPVIVEPSKVVSALKWATKEMDRRYKMFAEVGVRNIAAFNELSGFQAMPYIVIIIDELADLMLYSPAEVEECITRIAQMARAVGMHLVLATQRPSVDVITGLIKANIPTRIAFNVSSMTDSRVVLDSPGAEKLLGKGDMLYVPPDQAKATRVQGTFISDKEIRDLVDHIKKAGIQPEYQEDITTKFTSTKVSGGGGGGDSGAGENTDPLLDDSIKMCIEYDKASASVLQRRLSIGYSRAARIVDQLERLGIVGPQDGSKPREVNRKAAQEYLDKKMQDWLIED